MTWQWRPKKAAQVNKVHWLFGIMGCILLTCPLAAHGWDPSVCAQELFRHDGAFDARYSAQRSLGSGIVDLLPHSERITPVSVALADVGDIPKGADVFQALHFDNVLGADFSTQVGDITAHASRTLALMSSLSRAAIAEPYFVNVARIFNVDVRGVGSEYNQHLSNVLENVLIYNQRAVRPIRVVNASLTYFLRSGWHASADIASQITSQDEMVVVWAAGNEEGEEMLFSKDMSRIIPVAGLAIGARGLASFSNFGSWVSVAAPAEEIWSLEPSQGTSFAAPMVSGVLLGLWKIFPALSAQGAREILETTANRNGLFGDETMWGNGLPNAMLATVSARAMRSGEFAQFVPQKGSHVRKRNRAWQDFFAKISLAVDSFRIPKMLTQSLEPLKAYITHPLDQFWDVFLQSPSCSAYTKGIRSLWVRYFLSGGDEKYRKEMCQFFLWHVRDPSTNGRKLLPELLRYCDVTSHQMEWIWPYRTFGEPSFVSLLATPGAVSHPKWDMWMEDAVSLWGYSTVANRVMSQIPPTSHTGFFNWLERMVHHAPKDAIESVFSRPFVLALALKQPQWQSWLEEMMVWEEAEYARDENYVSGVLRLVLANPRVITKDSHWAQHVRRYIDGNLAIQVYRLLRISTTHGHSQWLALAKRWVIRMQQWAADGKATIGSVERLLCDVAVVHAPVWRDLMVWLMQSRTLFHSVDNRKVPLASYLLSRPEIVAHPKWWGLMLQYGEIDPKGARKVLMFSEPQKHPTYALLRSVL